MTKRAARFWMALVMAGAIVAPVSAQNQPQGWPDSARDAKKSAAAKPVVVKVKTAKTAKKAKTAPAVVTSALAAGTPAKEILIALQQQSELLKRLVSEIESQRALIAAQQDKITVIERRAAGLDEMRGTPARRFDYAALITGPAEDEDLLDRRNDTPIAGRDTYRPTFIKRLQFGGTGVWLQMNYLRQTFHGGNLFTTNAHPTR